MSGRDLQMDARWEWEERGRVNSIRGSAAVMASGPAGQRAIDLVMVLMQRQSYPNKIVLHITKNRM